MHKISKAYLTMFLTVACLLTKIEISSAQGTAFTYQGRLQDNGVVANGKYDFRFGLYPTNSGGNLAGNILTDTGVVVSNGLFTTLLDFGNIFGSTNYWLDISVRSNGTAALFTPVSPRQAVTAAPYAVYALTTAGAKVYATFRTHANENSVTNSLGAYAVAYGQPILFNQNNGIDIPSPSPVEGGITFSNVPDPSYPSNPYTNGPFLGVAQITVPFAGDYKVTWGAALLNTESPQFSIAKNGIPLPDTAISQPYFVLISSTTILSLSAGDALSVINTSPGSNTMHLNSVFTSNSTNSATTAYLTIELLH